MDKSDKTPIIDRLKRKGYSLGEEKCKSTGARMIIDKNGKKLGIISPLECVKKLGI